MQWSVYEPVCYLTAFADRFLVVSKESIMTPQGGLGGIRGGCRRHPNRLGHPRKIALRAARTPFCDCDSLVVTSDGPLPGEGHPMDAVARACSDLHEAVLVPAPQPLPAPGLQRAATVIAQASGVSEHVGELLLSPLVNHLFSNIMVDIISPTLVRMTWSAGSARRCPIE